MELSVIIPAYNEAERIAPTLMALHAYLRHQGFRYEILVVDDGSSDSTAGLVSAMACEIPGLRVLANSPNRGKGHAVRTGMLAALGEVRLMYDADGSMPAEEISKLVVPIFSGRSDIAVGSRYVTGAITEHEQPGWRVAWSRFANRVIQRSLVPGIVDTQCGFKAFSAAAAVAVFSRATINGWAFDLEALALAKRMGFVVSEHGVVWSDDERTRVHPVRDFIKVVREFVTIRCNLQRGRYGQLSAARGP